MSLRFKTMAELNAHIQQVRGPEIQSPKRKYRNEPVEGEGYKFDSKWELQRYRELKGLEQCGLIHSLRVKTPWGLHINGKRLGAYESDFDYFRDGVMVIEDTKSEATKTPLYLWKKDHFEAEYRLKIVEVIKRKRRAA